MADLNVLHSVVMAASALPTFQINFDASTTTVVSLVLIIALITIFLSISAWRSLRERTKSLETANQQLQHRAFQLETTATINKVIAPLLDIEQLNQETVNIIHARFGFDAVMLYLLNPSGRQVVLSKMAGQKGNSRSVIPLDNQSLIGQAITQLKPTRSADPVIKGTKSGYAELAVPLMAGTTVVGALNVQHQDGFDDDTIANLQVTANQVALAIERAQLHAKAIEERDRTNLLYELNSTLSKAHDFVDIMTKSMSFAARLGATFGEVHLLTSKNEVFFKSNDTPEGYAGNEEGSRQLSELAAAQSPDVLESAIIRFLHTSSYSPMPNFKPKSMMAAPIIVERQRLKGLIYVCHPQANQFTDEDRALVGALAGQIIAAVENTSLLHDIQVNLEETHLLLDISRQLSAATKIDDIYTALVYSIIKSGADRCTLHMCESSHSDPLPTQSQVVCELIRSQIPLENGQLPPFEKLPPYNVNKNSPIFKFAEYPLLQKIVTSQETIVIDEVKESDQLRVGEKALFTKHNSQSVLLKPLAARGQVIGFITIEYQTRHVTTDRELTFYRTLGNQATLAIESARQGLRTEIALAETQTLYRAGRVLARASSLSEILEEALVEFLYTLGLDQGGVTLLSADRQFGQLAAYVQDGLPQPLGDVLPVIEANDDDNVDSTLRFMIVEGVTYQEILLAGQPFVSEDVANDRRMAGFKSFNAQTMPKSLLLAPMIVQGETIGWIGADAVKRPRIFSQREVDLARAMADQIAIALQNRRLLMQTQRRAEQLQAVAQVGESVSKMLNLQDILKQAVELIKTRFKLYHVSIFVVEGDWAIVKASTGEVGQIMVNRPHKLQIDGNSIVGYVTGQGKPRIALDVGEDAVWFNNPMLPKTRSEMALPLLTHGGGVIGALDVQSEQPDAFSTEDVEILQIMANQLTAAIEKANLLSQTQRQLLEQAALHRIGSKVAATLDLGSAMNELVMETGLAVYARQVWLSWYNQQNVLQVAAEYQAEGYQYPSQLGQVLNLADSPTLTQVQNLGQPVVILAENETLSPETTRRRETGPLMIVLPEAPEQAYLREHHIWALTIVPVQLRQQTIGFLHVTRAEKSFSGQTMTLLIAIALQAAQAIETRQLYQQAQENQSFLTAILNQLPDPIFIKDRQRQLVVVNQAFATTLLGQESSQLLGRPDESYFPSEWVKIAEQQDPLVFKEGRSFEMEQDMRNAVGEKRTYYVRKTPLRLNEQSEPDYLLGIINDVTEQRLREFERERLIENTRQTLKRTQALYQISYALDTRAVIERPEEGQLKALYPYETFEVVLGEYLQLLNLAEGSIWLFNRARTDLERWAFYHNGQPQPTKQVTLPPDNLLNQLEAQQAAIVIAQVSEHPLTAGQLAPYGHTAAMSLLALPLIWRRQVQGVMVTVASQSSHRFSTNDIELGQTIAGQLARWLENRQLLAEADYRTGRLVTAAQISQASSSILDVNDLMETAVNLIRDQFNFYYVGLFLVEGEWAVLKAGTGEAGQRQLARNHRLKVGAGMIGWSVENGKARIALDVGADAVRFKNPDLPLTRSEMALPLVSRDEVLGALTVQSIEARAFSDEDITLLQTMADQLANAIKNAHLFAQTQTALSEMERLYQLSQELLSAEDSTRVYRLATHALAQSGAEWCAIVEEVRANTWYQVAGWSLHGDLAYNDLHPIWAAPLSLLLPTRGAMWQRDATSEEEPLPSEAAAELTRLGLGSTAILPLESSQRRLGFVVVGYLDKENGWPIFGREQIRFYHTLAQQMVVALENLHLLQISQKRARREEVIRQISSKIRGSTRVEDILQTTVSELSKLVGSSRGGITLAVPTHSLEI